MTDFPHRLFRVHPRLSVVLFFIRTGFLPSGGNPMEPVRDPPCARFCRQESVFDIAADIAVGAPLP